MVKNFILIGVGGALGSMLRYGLSFLIRYKAFPLATLLINVMGSFVIGLAIAYCAKNIVFEYNWKLFVVVGLCGGFTTFSSFSLENLHLLQNGRYFLSALYIVSSVLSGIAAAWFGFKFIH